MLSFALRIVVLAVAALGLYLVFRPGWDFTIVVNNHKGHLRGRFPEAHRARLLDFLRNDLDLPRTVRIFGRRASGGRLILRFRGPIDPPARQRVRNFLVNLL